MRVMTYRGPSNAHVLTKVKEELGSEAIILSNKTVTEGGKKVCEIMVAIDQPQEPEPPQKDEDTYLGGESAPSLPSSQAIGGWADEWGQIKDHLLALLRPQMDLSSLSPRQRLALEFLEREGVDPKVILSIYRTLIKDAGQSILPVLRKIAPIKPFVPEKMGSKFLVFTGPAGSGKTSALIRLALQDKKNNPGSRICLATCDTTQGKGRLVLKHYAELSGLAFREIAIKEDFAALMGDSAEFDRVYMDFPGLKNGETMREIMSELGMESVSDLSVHIVLNPYFAAAQYERFLKDYNCKQAGSLIWTKLDEACSFGSLINAAAISGLPVSAMSYGTGLRNSIVPAKDEALWRLIFKHQLPA